MREKCARSKTRFEVPRCIELEAWRTRDDFGLSRVKRLGRRHRQALEDALREVKKLPDLNPRLISPRTFPLPSLEHELVDWRTELETGRGLLRFDDFPIHQDNASDVELMFLGLGSHFGKAVPQSALGDFVGRVEGVAGRDPRARAYRNSLELGLHTDRCDVIGMLSLRCAQHGGESRLACGLAIHNEILHQRPDLLRFLYDGFRMHRFGEQPDDRPPLTDSKVPVFSIDNGVPTIVYLRAYIKLAVDEGYYALSEGQLEALDYFDSLSISPQFHYEWLSKPSEVFFFNNCVMLHGRRAFEDPPNNGGRSLLRLWLSLPGRPAVPSVLEYKYAAMDISRGASYYQGPGYRDETDLKVWY